jgi:Histidine kinase
MVLQRTRLIEWGILSASTLCFGYLLWRFGHAKTEGALDGDFGRYLLGQLIQLAILWAVAHASYRFAFLPLRIRAQRPWRIVYWLWLALLALLLFVFFEYQTDYEAEFADENVLLALLLDGFVAGYAYVADSFRTRHLQLSLHKMQAEQELYAVKSQIQPHFLFNALNTIFGSALKNNDEKTADLVGELSELLRFSIQESQRDYIDIGQDLAFMQRYINLQRARLPERPNIELTFNIDWDKQPAQIPPLLMIPLLENAFQYGISIDQPCFIRMDLVVKNKHLSLRLDNSISPATRQRNGNKTGLASLQKRLTLLYPDKHQFTTKTTPEGFRVQLEVGV